MKKILIFVYIALVSLLTIFSVTVYFQNRYISFTYRNTALVSLLVNSYEAYANFIAWVRSSPYVVARISPGQEGAIQLHLTDLSFDNRLVLISGLFPGPGEFAADYDTGYYNQSGLLRPLFPAIRITIHYLHTPERMHFSSLYLINEICELNIKVIADELATQGVYISLIDVWADYNMIVLLSSFTMVQNIVMFMIFLTAIAAMILCTTQFVFSKTIKINLLLSFGYGYVKIAGELIKMIFGGKMWIIAFSSLLGILFILVFAITSYRPFGLEIVTFFLLANIILIAMYLLAICGVGFLYLTTRKRRLAISLKGAKPHVLLLFFVSSMKFLSTIVLLSVILLLLNLFNDFTQERRNMQNWLIAQDMYTISLRNIGQGTDMIIEVRLQEKLMQLYQHLFSYHNGFFIDVNNIKTMEMFGINSPLTGLPISPFYTHTAARFYTHITVSQNYFIVNPIYTSSYTPVHKEIIFEDNVLNILVPESLMHIHDLLYERFMEYFYFHRIDIFNAVYQYVDGGDWVPGVIDDLSINIISTANHQSYFSFSSNVRQHMGGVIVDPVVVVYTGNFHPSYAYSLASRVLFFQPYGDMRGNINYYIAQVISMDNVAFASSIWASVLNRIAQLQQYYIGTIALGALVVLNFLVINFSFIINYYARKKKQVVLECLWGYGWVLRNRVLMVMLYMPVLVASLIFPTFVRLLNIALFYPPSIVYVVLLNVFIATIDIFFLASSEKSLMENLYRDVMKGDGS